MAKCRRIPEQMWQRGAGPSDEVDEFSEEENDFERGNDALARMTTLLLLPPAPRRHSSPTPLRNQTKQKLSASKDTRMLRTFLRAVRLAATSRAIGAPRLPARSLASSCHPSTHFGSTDLQEAAGGSCGRCGRKLPEAPHVSLAWFADFLRRKYSRDARMHPRPHRIFGRQAACEDGRPDGAGRSTSNDSTASPALSLPFEVRRGELLRDAIRKLMNIRKLVNSYTNHNDDLSDRLWLDPGKNLTNPRCSRNVCACIHPRPVGT